MVDIASSLTNLQEKIQLLLKRAALMEKENMQLKASLNKEQNHVKELMDEVQQGKSKIAAAMVNTASMQPTDKEALIKKVDHYIKEIDTAIKKKIPLIIISKSGGARMMEGAISLMQMAKTSAKLAQLSNNKLPYVSLCTDPTTGGTTASFAMLGDINISEPGALIAFAGPRVVKDTTGKDLPEGFQTSEFLLEHGFLDFITSRTELKKKINLYFDLILNRPLRSI